MPDRMLESGRVARDQLADVDRMETVDVLPGVYAQQDVGLVDVIRERQLNQHAVHCGVGVELVDGIQQLRLCDGGRQPDRT